MINTKKAIERGYKHAQTEYVKSGIIPDMSDPKYVLCSKAFNEGVKLFANEVRNQLDLKKI